VKLNEIFGKQLVITKDTKFGEIMKLDSDSFSKFQQLFLDNGIEGSMYNTILNAKADNFLLSPTQIENEAMRLENRFIPFAVIRLVFGPSIANQNVGEFRMTSASAGSVHMFCYAGHFNWIVRNRPNKQKLYYMVESFPDQAFDAPLYNNLHKCKQEITTGDISDDPDAHIAGWVLFK